MNKVHCDNEKCKKGLGGKRAVFIKSRPHHIYCCQSCRVEAWNDRRAGGAKVVELEKRVKDLELLVNNHKNRLLELEES
jgi:hypothetical protein